MMNNFGFWISEFGLEECKLVRSEGPCPQSAIRNPRSAVVRRRGLTLIELLITMTIIAVISAAILGTAAAAMENARRGRTRSIISKLNGLVMERWDSYATRRVDVSPAFERAVNTWANAPGLIPAERTVRLNQRGQMIADARLLALRKLIKMEMPDRWSDIANQTLDSGDLPLVQNTPTFLDRSSVPGLARTYYRRLLTAQDNVGGDMDTLKRYQSAECLYMLVMYGTGDGEARTLFTSQDIGDTDGDGAPEFLDGWGNPIRFIRWPTGFITISSRMTGDGDADHDPFDPFRRDTPKITPSSNPKPELYPNPFDDGVATIRARNARGLTTPTQPPYLFACRLVPLIFSHGADEQGGLYSVEEVTEGGDSEIINLDPYAADDDGVQSATPDPDSNAWRDNIHNHVNEY